ncbi:hypothetical protein [Komagataeibacter europaeus]|uniref:hypothetical protein n=1 Tax=Komagataeibacter europaeus TaxID=33995 RepID=UPI0015FDA4DE|nr:hypothetical protein [Komagataeibacter europaeus]
MSRSITLIAMFLAACIFGWRVPLETLFNAFSSLTTALSIVSAAVFVRLNRGMPSFEWKSADPKKRSHLTSAILELTKEYVGIIAINGILLSILIILTTYGKPSIAEWSHPIQRITSGLIGGLITLCVIRMSYVTWRDYDIVHLQKELIDATAHDDDSSQQENSATEKLQNIQSAGLKKFPTNPPQSWND